MQEATDLRPKKSRSPSYPAIDLEAAIGRARRVYDLAGRHPLPVGDIMKAWGYSSRSSGGLVTLAALKKFDLLTDEGSGADRQAKLSDLALRIIEDERPDSTERADAIREAALRPIAHQEIWDKYGSENLPPDPTLRFYLKRERHFTETGATEFIQELRATWAFARLEEGASLLGNRRDKEQIEGGGLGAEIKLSGEVGTKQDDPKTGVRIQTLRAPLGGGKAVLVQMPERLSPKEWERFEANLAAWKLGTVEDEPNQPEGTS